MTDTKTYPAYQARWMEGHQPLLMVRYAQFPRRLKIAICALVFGVGVFCYLFGWEVGRFAGENRVTCAVRAPA